MLNANRKYRKDGKLQPRTQGLIVGGVAGSGDTTLDTRLGKLPKWQNEQFTIFLYFLFTIYYLFILNHILSFTILLEKYNVFKTKRNLAISSLNIFICFSNTYITFNRCRLIILFSN